MIITILIVLFSLVILVTIHELGHFLFAKKFGVKVEEFGIGFPPRLFGKKIGETIYSINLLPLGAFVKIMGEDGGSTDPRSFSQKPIWQRAIILAAGVVAFWIVAILIFTSIVAFSNIPTAVTDDFIQEGITPYVQIYAISADSPADVAGIKVGDEILNIKVSDAETVDISTVGEVQNLSRLYGGNSITLFLSRGEETLDVSLTPRIDPENGEGAMGIGLVRVANLETVWYKSPIVGAQITWEQTKAIPTIMVGALVRKIRGEKVTDVQIVSPIGVVQIMGQALQIGFANFLMFMGMIAIWLALFNLLPIPALDGGRLLFLLIEWLRKKPISHKIEGKITGVFFFLLVGLMLVLTLRDIIRLF